MCDKILLEDILDIINSKIDLYYKGSYVGEFTKEELKYKYTDWLYDKVISIENEGESTISIYLTYLNRNFQRRQKMKDKPRNLEHHKCKNCDYYANGRCVWCSRKVDRDNWCKNYTKY